MWSNLINVTRTWALIDAHAPKGENKIGKLEEFNSFTMNQITPSIKSIIRQENRRKGLLESLEQGNPLEKLIEKAKFTNTEHKESLNAFNQKLFTLDKMQWLSIYDIMNEFLPDIMEFLHFNEFTEPEDRLFVDISTNIFYDSTAFSAFIFTLTYNLFILKKVGVWLQRFRIKYRYEDVSAVLVFVSLPSNSQAFVFGLIGTSPPFLRSLRIVAFRCTNTELHGPRYYKYKCGNACLVLSPLINVFWSWKWYFNAV